MPTSENAHRGNEAGVSQRRGGKGHGDETHMNQTIPKTKPKGKHAAG